MHPPFGFALFYLRGIAPPSIKTSDIYWGAIPWVFLQVILVVIVIFWPGSVTYWIDKGPTIDPSKIEIKVPTFGTDGGVGLGLPPFGQGTSPAFPSLPTTGPDFGTPKAPEGTPTEPSAQSKPEDGPKPEEPK
jgi:hypothetical protein